MSIVIKAEPERVHLGKAKWIGNTDGDTPTIQLNIRLLGIDTPELHYPGTTRPSKYDYQLESLMKNSGKKWEAGLKKFLSPKLANKPGTLQETWGQKAKEKFAELALQHLEEINPNTARKRHKGVFLTVGEQVFDQYKRLLSYVAPDEEDAKKRKTFNLLLMEEGMAINYIIFPNLPKLEDWERVQKAVQKAKKAKSGFWSDSRILLGYEYRFCVDTALGKRQGPDKYCADITSGLLYPPQKYHLIEPENRLFIYEKDLKAANKRLNLKK